MNQKFGSNLIIHLVEFMQIIGKANELNEDILTVSCRFSQLFLNEMTDLQCLPPTHEPRVSSHMAQIINMINEVITSFTLSQSLRKF